MTYPFASSVTWISRTVTGRDAYGDNVTTETATPLAAVFAPGGSAELVQGGDVVTTQPTLYGIPAGTLIKATDAFDIGGVRYEVDGDPQDGLQSPFSGWSPGTVIRLRKVTGG